MITYKKSGVDIKKAEKIVGNLMHEFPEIGGFAGIFQLGKYKLAATCDGVGTKIKLAIEFDKHEVVGEDLVAMSVNDLIAQRAKPLFFLDYFSCAKLKTYIFQQVLKGIKRGLKKANCKLLGGEIAEMPGMYQGNDYDLAGFSCGILLKQFKKEKIKKGDLIVGLKSNGVHSNGFSLIRKIFDKKELKKYRDLILKPTKIYSLFIHHPSLFSSIKSMAHITGGGLERAVKRLLPAGGKAEIVSPILSGIFKVIHEKGVSLKEMNGTFNMGWGMLLITGERETEKVLKITKGKIIGRVK